MERTNSDHYTVTLPLGTSLAQGPWYISPHLCQDKTPISEPSDLSFYPVVGHTTAGIKDPEVGIKIQGDMASAHGASVMKGRKRTTGDAEFRPNKRVREPEAVAALVE